jgi:ribosomal protein L22
MTALEKKQKLIRMANAIPDQFIDEATNALDSIIKKEEQVQEEKFNELLATTSEQYKEVFKDLASIEKSPEDASTTTNSGQNEQIELITQQDFKR